MKVNQLLILLVVQVGIVVALERVNDYTFDKLVKKSGNYVLVDFYADWCRHCQKLMPTIERLSEEYQDIPGVDIYKHNGGERSGRKMVKKYEIDGFPLLALFHGNDKPIFYEGGRDFESINNFLKLSTGIYQVENPDIKPAEGLFGGKLLAINDYNLGELVLNSPKKTLLMVSGDWCKYCKKVKPDFLKLPEIFQYDENIQFGIVDLDIDGGSTNKIKAQFGVESIPDILLFDPEKVDDDGLRRPTQFTGDKSLKNMVEFINENTGLNRQASGRLNNGAGKLVAIDSMVPDLFSGANGVNIDIGYKLSEALNQHLQGNPSEEFAVNYYQKVIGKLIEGDFDYVSRELERLTKLSNNSNVKVTQRDSIDTRINILTTFQSFK